MLVQGNIQAGISIQAQHVRGVKQSAASTDAGIPAGIAGGLQQGADGHCRIGHIVNANQGGKLSYGAITGYDRSDVALGNGGKQAVAGDKVLRAGKADTCSWSGTTDPCKRM